MLFGACPIIMRSTLPMVTPLYFNGAPTSSPLTLSEKYETNISVLAKNFAAPKIITAAPASTDAAITNMPIATGFTLFFILTSLLWSADPRPCS